MKVTRTLQANCPDSLLAICKVTGFLRADLWRRYGALKNVGKSCIDIRKEITESCIYSGLAVDGTIRAETTKDIINDILTYKAAAKLKVKPAIFNRATDPQESKRLFTLLQADQWLEDPFLHRQMRKHFKHGVSHTSNQFIVRSDRYLCEVVDGRLVITIKIASRYGTDIKLITTTNGRNVNLTGVNLRVIVKEGFTEIHYVTDKGEGRPHGDRVLGIDKGYTEAFTDSDGDHHGEKFGAVMTEYSDMVASTGGQRNKLHALEKKHRANGNITKANNILNHNLGRKKLESRREQTRKRLRTLAYQATHTVVDKAALVVSEDLTAPIAKKQQWKRYNRRMSAWAKGILAEALDSVCTQRKASHVLVNGAYTSQMDSTTGLLKGKRDGDKFYRANGDVLQADHNAALNVLARLSDSEIKRFTPHQEVRWILLARSPAQLSVMRLELADETVQPSADKSMCNFAQV
jgi:transposase